MGAEYENVGKGMILLGKGSDITNTAGLQSIGSINIPSGLMSAEERIIIFVYHEGLVANTARIALANAAAAADLYLDAGAMIATGNAQAIICNDYNQGGKTTATYFNAVPGMIATASTPTFDFTADEVIYITLNNNAASNTYYAWSAYILKV